MPLEIKRTPLLGKRLHSRGRPIVLDESSPRIFCLPGIILPPSVESRLHGFVAESIRPSISTISHCQMSLCGLKLHSHNTYSHHSSNTESTTDVDYEVSLSCPEDSRLALKVHARNLLCVLHYFQSRLALGPDFLPPKSHPLQIDKLGLHATVCRRVRGRVP